MLNKLSNKLWVGFMGLLAMFGLASYTHAAADADLVAGFASSTGMYNDNKGVIIGYAVTVIIAATIIGLVIRALFFGRGTLLGVFGGRRRRR